MNIIVCCKLAPDTNDLRVLDDGSVSVDRAEWVIGDFDLVAMEAGVQAAASCGAKLVALSAGNKKLDNSKSRKDILSRGPEELFVVADDALEGADSARTAQVLANAAQKIGDYNLIVCGEGSADLYFQQVGLQMGEKLGLPTINGVSKIQEITADKVVVQRSTEDEFETLEIALPAVLSVTADICQARLPKMQEILKAGKKPVTELALAEVGDGAEQSDVLGLKAPKSADRKNIVFDGDVEAAVKEIVANLVKDGVL